MLLEIDNHLFEGEYKKDNRLKLKLKDKSDIKFFEDWSDMIKSDIHIPKKDYVKDIIFFKTFKYGIFKNCFPIISRNMDFVEIIFDVELQK